MKDDFQDSFTFDRLDRETAVVQQAATTTGHYGVGYKKSTFSWDNADRLTSLNDYKDASTQAVQGSFSYDHVSRLTSLNWSGYGGPYTGGYFDKLAWSFDSDSRVASFTSGINSNENLTYTYDHDSQLTSAAASYGGYGGGYGGYGGGSYGWDGNGDTTTSGWITGRGNRLLQDGTYRYFYDVSGHMTKRVALSTTTVPYETDYAWDNRGRMISATNLDNTGVIQQKVDLNYDVFNDLITRTVTPYSAGLPVTGSITTAHFVFDLAAADALPGGATIGDGPGVRGSGQAVLAFDGNQSLTDHYVWGPAVDEILADGAEKGVGRKRGQAEKGVRTIYLDGAAGLG